MTAPASPAEGLGRFLRGAGVFVDDIRLPGMLHLAFVRSPHAHARIAGFDGRAALATRGVVAVLAAQDLGSFNTPIPVRFQHPGLRHARMPAPLAHGVTRHVGEPVCAVLADSGYLAADAADLVQVHYEPLPAAATVEQARAGSPLVHEDAGENVAGTYTWRVGDPTRALEEAPVRLRCRLTITRGVANPIEPRGCVAAYDAHDGRLTLWASTQSPHYLKKMTAQTLGLDEARVRVIAPDVGGAFGVKGGAPREYLLAAFAAMRTGRPVKWAESRSEHFVACQHDRDQIHHVEVGATPDGRLLALRDLFWLDVGAYTLYGHLLGVHTAAHIVGPYRLPHLEVCLESVFTHRVPTGAYRGAGRPQGVFVIERVMDRVAREVGLDPAEVRARNLIPPEAMPWDSGLELFDGHRVRYDSGDYPHLLRTALDRFDYSRWRREQQRRRRSAAGEALLGIGIACYVEQTASHGHEAVTVRMTGADRATVAAGPPSQGQEHRAMLARLVAGELGIPVERVLVTTGDTAAVMESFGTFGSRVATLLGNAAALAARRLSGTLRRHAADLLGCQPDQVVLTSGRAVCRDDFGRSVTHADLFARATALEQVGPAWDELEATVQFSQEDAAWASGVHLAVVEIDRDTGAVRILRYLVVHDSGRVLDEEAVRRQV
ncbi:MAG: xanthine dehydrogenase family protein molybdopterin-binding subunit, partial [Armatimonadota bacterium]|nr:xanthine dehydrogenase family protein molybdopterin-binding subunit [Armatimonadota bacterium]